MTRRFPIPWIVESIEGGFKVVDASGQALAYVYCRDDANAAGAADRSLTRDEGWRIAANVAKLPLLLSHHQGDKKD